MVEVRAFYVSDGPACTVCMPREDCPKFPFDIVTDPVWSGCQRWKIRMRNIDDHLVEVKDAIDELKALGANANTSQFLVSKEN